MAPKIAAKPRIESGIPPSVIQWVQKSLDKPIAGSVTLELPSDAKAVPCRLVGPAMNDPSIEEPEVAWVRIDSKPFRSRCVHTAKNTTRLVTVLVTGDGLIASVYAGPPRPVEMHDPALDELTPAEQREASNFWTRHALAV